ncbi:hypothetical protein DMENIID0001_091480 [Sergentomyia squamirostris]
MRISSIHIWGGRKFSKASYRTGGPTIINEGSDALLTCVIMGSFANDTVLWRKGPNEILSAGMNRVTMDKRISILHDDLAAVTKPTCLLPHGEPYIPRLSSTVRRSKEDASDVIYGIGYFSTWLNHIIRDLHFHFGQLPIPPYFLP